MKYVQLVLLSLFLFIFSSCKKDKDKDTREVRYEFTSDYSAAYRIEYTIDNNQNSIENFTGTNWSKTVSITKIEGYAVPTLVKLAVFPPASWANTGQQANVRIKIFVNGSENVSKTGVLTANDISTGIWEIVTL